MEVAINVSVFKPKNRKFYVCQWVDPITGRKKKRSAGTNIKRDAERFAGQLQRELENGTYHADVRMTWADFREHFQEDHLSNVSKSTANRYITALNALEDLIDPKHLSSINESVVNRFTAGMRKRGNSEATIKSNLVMLKVALKWAVGQKYLQSVPTINLPKNTEAMKGRPITQEEFERMLAKIPDLNFVNPDEWEFMLRGLWWSGLRLGEALRLHWTDDREMCVDLDDEVFIIQAAAQKKRKYTQTPMAPEFVDMLREVPEDQREGFVFNPIGSRDRKGRIIRETASALITKLGQKAGVKVAETLNGKSKWASAHDMRRAFGFRWSRLIMPAELQELMRHEDISTTMKFYVGRNAKETVKRLRTVLGATSGATTKASDSETLETLQIKKPDRDLNPD